MSDNDERHDPRCAKALSVGQCTCPTISRRVLAADAALARRIAGDR